jgi:hypothetical protein
MCCGFTSHATHFQIHDRNGWLPCSAKPDGFFAGLSNLNPRVRKIQREHFSHHVGNLALIVEDENCKRMCHLVLHLRGTSCITDN